jgi:predicted kinase
MKTLTIIRGLPGSGKSTLAKAMSTALGHTLLDVDDYFTDDDGVFEYSLSKAPEVFRKLHSDADDLITTGKSVIVVATFTRRWEVNGYIRMPYDRLQVIDCCGNFGSIHNVPKTNMLAMRNRWEPWK